MGMNEEGGLSGRCERAEAKLYDTERKLAALREELADMKHWRDLALQFDNHRMTALWHLKTLAVNPSYAPAVSEFLASPPLPASEIVQRLTAAEQRNARHESKLRHFASCADVSQVGTLAMEYVAALKPTESGASE